MSAVVEQLAARARVLAGVEAANDAPGIARLGDALDGALVRIARRCDGRERPISLPWPSLAAHFGGGLWPGLHVLNKGTGVGGTQLALQVMLAAAGGGVPGLYVGLEMGELDVAIRALGLEGGVPWSHLWTGTAGPTYVRRATAAAPALRELPVHYVVPGPNVCTAASLREMAERMRATYPETDGPGSRPILLVVDFLQLVGSDAGEDTRERIGRAAYSLREISSRFGAVVVTISGVARDKYSMASIHKTAGLTWTTDPSGYPIERRVSLPDAVVGWGKESGEIEYSADSVSVLAKVPGAWSGAGSDAVLITAKGRATGPTWSALHFNGYCYTEPEDRGGRVVDAWEALEERRASRREERATKREAKRNDRRADLCDDIRAALRASPGLTFRALRSAVGCADSTLTAALAGMAGEVHAEDGPRGASLHYLTDGGA